MDTIPDLLKSIIGSVVRNAGTPVIAWLAARGWVTPDDGQALLTVIVVSAAAIVWGIWQKYQATAVLSAALRLPANATIEEAKASVK